MKRYCKSVDITDLHFIESAVFACLAKKCKRIFRRARRVMLRMRRFIRHHAKASVKLARRAVSYYGWLTRTNCKHFLSAIRAAAVMHVAGAIIKQRQATQAI